jgi:hypothetical protein
MEVARTAPKITLQIFEQKDFMDVLLLGQNIFATQG